MQNPMMFTRSVKGAPASILFALLLTRQAMTVKVLCTYTDYKPDSIREALDVLTNYGLVRENKLAHGESIFGLAEGYDMLLPGINPRALGMVGKQAGITAEEDIEEPQRVGTIADLPAADSEGQIQSPKKSDSGSETLPENREGQIQSPKKSDSGSETLPEDGKKRCQNPKKSDSGGENQGSINQLIDDDDELIKFHQTSSSSSIMNPNLNFSTPGAAQKTEQVVESRVTAVFPESKFPSLEKILAGMDILFGDHLEPSLFAPDLSPKVALAWICKGYLDARRNPEFKNPVGMIRRRLEKKEPRSLSHLQEMPAEFLEFIGMFEGVCPFCHAGFRTRRELNEHLLTGHTHTEPADEEPDAFEDEEEIEATDPVAQEIWESTKALLQDEMPRASFETWVQGSRGVAVAEKTLRVVARNQFAADWLRERISDDCLVIFGRMGRGIESVSFAVGTAR